MRFTTVRFVDTNILLYAISRDPAEQDKAKRANSILADRDPALSVQVLQEFYVQATCASRPDALGHSQAVRLIESRFAASPSRTSPARS
jgi:predicted nucleic acid-binding protein